jgi:lipoate-protein ligase B
MTRQGYCLELETEEYGDMLRLQETISRARRLQIVPDTLLILEHHPCITIGRKGGFDHILVSDNMLRERGIRVYETDRGGDITYHGPGQIVCYPIIDLSNYDRDVHVYAEKMEEMLIQSLFSFGIVAGRKEKYPGIWVGSEKIGAIGIGIRQWVTMHGVSLNICPDMHHFSLIVPCGISTLGVTSMEKILGYRMEIREVRREIRKQFSKIFDIHLENIGLEKMRGKGIGTQRILFDLRKGEYLKSQQG